MRAVRRTSKETPSEALELELELDDMLILGSDKKLPTLWEDGDAFQILSIGSYGYLQFTNENDKTLVNKKNTSAFLHYLSRKIDSSSGVYTINLCLHKH